MNSLRLHVTAFLAALVLMAFAVFNGYATFFNDSRSYIRGGMMVVDTLLQTKTAPEWKSRVEMATLAPRSAVTGATATTAAPQAEPPTANRSVYYGILAFAGYITSDFWLTIFVQAYAVGYVIALLAARIYGMTGWPVVLVVVAPVALLTTVGPFISNIMPDIFTGVGILAVLVLCWWPRLTRSDRLGLFLVISFGLLAHTSHIAILAVLMVLAVPLLWWLDRGRALRAPIEFLVSTIGVAVIGVMAFNAAATRVSGQKPLLMPHLTAHLVEMGPGMTLIRDSCPDSGYAVCDFADRLPVPWIDFISSRSRETGVFEVADLPTKRRLSEEQIPFALAVARHDPLGLAVGMAGDIFGQLGWFNLRTMKHNDKVAEKLDATFPPHVASAISGSRIGVSEGPLEVIETTNAVLTIIALLYLGWVIIRRRDGHPVDREIAVFFLVIGLGLVANAIVCGGLASPNPRFQARVIWLVPFIGLAHLVWGRLARPRLPPTRLA